MQVASSSQGALPCSMVNSLTRDTEEQCKFIIDNDCLEDEATIDYVYLVFCEMTYDMRHVAVSLIVLLVIVLFLNLSAVADEFLCPSLLTVARHLRMSDSLAGVTLLAFGNGCPDIFSSLAAASSGRPELIVGELLGAGIFCTSIVAGLIFINNDFKIARRPLLRDISFYLLAVYLIWLYCHQGRVTFYGSIAFIVIYVIYLFIALSGQAIHSRMRGEYPLAEKQRQHQHCQHVAYVHHNQQVEGKEHAEAGDQVKDEKLQTAGTRRDQLANVCERADDYESWFAWRDESGRRRSSVKREQIELARREIQRSKGRRMSLGSLAFQEAPPYEEPELGLGVSTTGGDGHQAGESEHACSRHNGCHVARASVDTLQQYHNIALNNDKSTIISVFSLCDHATEPAKEKGGESAATKEHPHLAAPTGDCPTIKVDRCDAAQVDSSKKQPDSGEGDSSAFSLSELDDFLFRINPINSIIWSDSRPLVKLMSVLRAPVLFLTILTVPVVDNEKQNNNWCRLLNSIHCFMVPCAVIMFAKLQGASPDGNSGAGGVGGGLEIVSSSSLPMSSSSLWPPGGSAGALAQPRTPYNQQDLSLQHNSSAIGPERPDLSVAASFVNQLDEFESLKLILMLAPGFALGLFVFATSQAHRAPRYHTVFAYFGFAMSIAWIYVLATEIVSLLKTVGIIFSMSDTAIGLSVLAWGNSLGDIVANLTLAEAGYARMALGASIGAPLLNLLLGFGLSFSLSLKPGELVAIEHGRTITLLASTLALVLLLLLASTLAPAGARSKKPLGFLLIACYALYFGLAICLEYGLFETLT